MKIFIDTSAFVALLVENEQSHIKVAKKYLTYREQRAIFFTSQYILDELFTRLLYYQNIDLKKIIETLQSSIMENELTILQINDLLFQKSLAVFLKYSEHKLSFTDATSYMLYKDFSLDEIFTLDSNFKKMRTNISF